MINLKGCFLFLLLMTYISSVANAQIRFSEYDQVNEIEGVVDWLKDLESGRSGADYKQFLDNIAIMLIRLDPSTSFYFDAPSKDIQIGYKLVSDPEIAVYVSVEERTIKLYLALIAGPNRSVYEYYDRGEALKNGAQELANFEMILKMVYEIGRHLEKFHKVSPLQENFNEFRPVFQDHGAYYMAAIPLSKNLPNTLIEEFLLSIWLKLERGVALNKFKTSYVDTCEAYLAK